jgi:signal transduction histidine kinase
VTDSSLDRDRLRALLDARRTLLEQLDVDLVLARLLDIARELTGARYAAVGVLGEDRDALSRFVTSGIDEQTQAAIGALPRGHGVLGLLIEDPHPLRLHEVGEHPRSFGFPLNHPPMHSFLGVPVRIGDEVWGNLYLTEKAAGDFDDADEEAATVLSEWAAIAIDNARVHARSELRRQELERAVSRLEASTDIALAVGGETDSARVLELIVKRGRALVGARAMVILIRDGEELVVAATAGELSPGLAGTRLDLSESVAERVLGTGRPEALTDVSERMSLQVGELDIKPTTGLFVPLIFRGRDVGVLEAFDRTGPEREFDSRDTELLTSFAASAAIAIASAQTVDADRLRHSVEATEQERRRWARELHDETLQGLASLRVLLAAARRVGGAERLEHAVDDAIAQLDQEMDSLHSLITELRPASLDDIGLAAAIEALGERTAALQGLVIESRVALGDDDLRLHPDLESTIYRLVQEALNNVVKHAAATRVGIDIARHAGEVDVRVSDDGGGFDASVATPGFGLRGMQERAALADGRLTVDTTAQGTTVHAVLPLRLPDV